jgi:hypothetical protein
MQRRAGAYLLFAICLFQFQAAVASELPPIKISLSNPMPACSTPGRMMAYLKSRNPELDPRYAGVATEYMRQGEQLGVRWDYAFFQMIIETGSLSYRRGNRAGDVRPVQNNFAGLGATGGGEHGESFKDIASGVRAHLEHLLLYSGQKLENPVAERTRKVQEWGVLADWHANFKRPITFTDLATKWAPGSNSYRKMLEGVAERFEEFCVRPDPHPQLVQEARAGRTEPAEPKAADLAPERPSGADLARRAIDHGKVQGDEQRASLGAQQSAKPSVGFKVLNAPGAESETQTSDGVSPQPPPKATDNANATTARVQEAGPRTAATARPGATAKSGSADKAQMQMASAAGMAAKPSVQATPPAPGQKCRVWTASYGGQKAMIIKSVSDSVINYTVLDVNDGAEAREAEAFISAYAKNGAITGEFVSQSQALEKAFELCPEG